MRAVKTTRFRHSFISHANQDHLEESRLLYVLGELAPKDQILLEQHSQVCRECRDSIREFEKLILFDLPAAAVIRSDGSVAEGPPSVDPDQLLAEVRERARKDLRYGPSQSYLENPIQPACAVHWRQRVAQTFRSAVPAAGWAVAAALLLWSAWTRFPAPHAKATVQTESVASSISLPNVAKVERRLDVAQDQTEVLAKKLSQAESRARHARLAYSRLNMLYETTNEIYSASQGELRQEKAKLTEQTEDLQRTRDALKDQVAAKDSLQRRLSEVSSRLEKQQDELAHVESVAASVPATFPSSEQTVGSTEAKEILGARDLHIVDVYDVDHSGNSSAVYGRVYYVNHSQLIFYAFDLSKLDRKHKAVAFQAWGYLQPDSSAVQNLGLFYLDNATLNRWTLRVSDPQVLSRIDTLFVTVEPPGGSRFPRGQRLLKASLAGPPNHP